MYPYERAQRLPTAHARRGGEKEEEKGKKKAGLQAGRRARALDACAVKFSPPLAAWAGLCSFKGLAGPGGLSAAVTTIVVCFF